MIDWYITFWIWGLLLLISVLYWLIRFPRQFSTALLFGHGRSPIDIAVSIGSWFYTFGAVVFVFFAVLYLVGQ